MHRNQEMPRFVSHLLTHYRKSLIAGLTCLATLFVALPSIAQSVDLLSPVTASQNFMQAYFQLHDNTVKSALRMSTGAAKAAVEKKIAAMKGSANSPTRGTESMLPLLYLSNKKINDSTYQVMWHYQPGTGKPYEVQTTAVKKGNDWLVSSFTSAAPK